jgi:hypothetical protein
MVNVSFGATEQPAMYDAAEPQLVSTIAIDLDPANFRPEIFVQAFVQVSRAKNRHAFRRLWGRFDTYSGA